MTLIRTAHKASCSNHWGKSNGENNGPPRKAWHGSSSPSHTSCHSFFSWFVRDYLPQTTYMDSISQSPVRNDMVGETMVSSVKVAEETNQGCSICCCTSIFPVGDIIEEALVFLHEFVQWMKNSQQGADSVQQCYHNQTLLHVWWTHSHLPSFIRILRIVLVPSQQQESGRSA